MEKHLLMMTNSSSFDLNRLWLLGRQFWIYHKRMVYLSIIGTVAVIFLLMFALQMVSNAKTWTPNQFIMLYIWMHMIAAVVFSGNSFNMLRSKKKAYSYLSLPASALEKFSFEFLLRVVVFILLFPLMYWLVFHLASYLWQLFEPAFAFHFFTFVEAFNMPSSAENTWMILHTCALGLLFLTVPFLGALWFKKHPIIKTIAWAAGVLFILMILYTILQRSGISIFPDRSSALIIMTCIIFTINVAIIIRSYFLLIRKQY